MGQKRLEKAIASFQSRHHSTSQQQSPLVIQVEWKPYIIDPGTNPTGEDFEAYNRRRWGSSGWTHHLKSEGRKDGATFQRWDWWPNTMKAHCLVKFANEKYDIETSRSNSVLFDALYEQGKNISLTDVLVQVGKDDLDLPESELHSYLESGEGVLEVKNEIKKGQREYQISGVPFFVISKDDGDDGGQQQQPYGLSGAQKSQTFEDVFEDLYDA